MSIAKPPASTPKRKAAKLPRFDPAAFLETAAKGRVISKYKKKDVLFEQGDPAESVVYIKSGKVKVTVLSKEGNEAVVAILGTDEFLGEGCLIGQPKRLATASALTDCTVMEVSKSEIEKVLVSEHALFPNVHDAYIDP